MCTFNLELTKRTFVKVSVRWPYLFLLSAVRNWILVLTRSTTTDSWDWTKTITKVKRNPRCKSLVGNYEWFKKRNFHSIKTAQRRGRVFEQRVSGQERVVLIRWTHDMHAQIQMSTFEPITWSLLSVRLLSQFKKQYKKHKTCKYVGKSQQLPTFT